MGLQHGGSTAPQEQIQNSMTAEQQREVKLGIILRTARRWWRIICLGMWVLGIIAAVYDSIVHGSSFIGNAIMATIGMIVFYAFNLYLFLYILAGRTIQAFLYLRDLFGGSKETRL